MQQFNVLEMEVDSLVLIVLCPEIMFSTGSLDTNFRRRPSPPSKHLIYHAIATLSLTLSACAVISSTTVSAGQYLKESSLIDKKAAAFFVGAIIILLFQVAHSRLCWMPDQDFELASAGLCLCCDPDSGYKGKYPKRINKPW